MKKIIFIDEEKLNQYYLASSRLARKLEFMKENQNSNNKHFKQRLIKDCTPDKLWELQKEIFEIEKSWKIGEINLNI